MYCKHKFISGNILSYAEYLSMSGPISDGEYLMSIMWTRHSIFPEETLLKQQGIILLNKSVFKTFHL